MIYLSKPIFFYSPTKSDRCVKNPQNRVDSGDERVEILFVSIIDQNQFMFQLGESFCGDIYKSCLSISQRIAPDNAPVYYLTLDVQTDQMDASELQLLSRPLQKGEKGKLCWT